MTNVHEIIPQNLQVEVDAALAWFNSHEKASFEVTGIVDPPAVSNSGQDLRLVLCGEVFVVKKPSRLLSLIVRRRLRGWA